MAWGQRRYVIAGSLAVVALVTWFVLFDVFAAVFFAITIAYILYPLRVQLVERGFGPRVAAGLCTGVALLAGIVLFAPLVVSLYLRRGQLFVFLQELPLTLTLSAFGREYQLHIAQFINESELLLESLAVEFVRQLPGLVLKFFLFTLVVYALLLRPQTVSSVLLKPVPEQHRDIAFAFHRRIQSILYAIYVLQAAVALFTFIVAVPFFLAFGYSSAFTLAVFAGILQFLPVVGPSLLVVGLAGLEILSGELLRAALIAVGGSLVIGLLPDVLVRPRLARLTADIPGSLYFVGFTGGLLSLGMIGIIAGPVAVALVAESVRLLSADSASAAEQQELGLSGVRARPDDLRPATE